MENNKIKMAKEVMDMFQFLGIDPIQFQKMKESFGSLEQLHKHLESFITETFIQKLGK